jgi:hypothetical protein
MQEHGKMEVQLHSILTSELHGGEWAASHLSRSSPRKETPVPTKHEASISILSMSFVPRPFFPSSFPTKTLQTFLASLTHHICPANLTILEVNNIKMGLETHLNGKNTQLCEKDKEVTQMAALLTKLEI